MRLLRAASYYYSPALRSMSACRIMLLYYKMLIRKYISYPTERACMPCTGCTECCTCRECYSGLLYGGINHGELYRTGEHCSVRIVPSPCRL